MLFGKFSENYSDKRENISGHAKWSSEWKLNRLILFAVKKIKNQRQFACIITYRMYKCLTFRMCSYKCLKILKTIVTWKLICTLSNFDKNYGCLSGLRAKKTIFPQGRKINFLLSEELIAHVGNRREEIPFAMDYNNILLLRKRGN